jgi:hypothetical protein
MNISIHTTTDVANTAAADSRAASWTHLGTRKVIVAGGNTSLEGYGLVAERRLKLSEARVFLDDNAAVALSAKS